MPLKTKASLLLKNRTIQELLVFVVVFGLYLANLPFDYKKNMETRVPRRLITSRDNLGNIFLPYLIVKHNTLDFTQKKDEIGRYTMYDQYYIVKINDGYYSKYPVLMGLMALPIYLPALLLNKIPNLKYWEKKKKEVLK